MTGIYQIEIKGIEKLIAKLESAVKEDVIKSSMTLGGQLLAGWSKKNRLSGPRPQYLGVRTNRLRSSISSSEAIKSGNEYSVKVGTNVEYARIHEFGGMTGRGLKTRMPARPFLRPSVEDTGNRQRILDILTENINRALGKK